MISSQFIHYCCRAEPALRGRSAAALENLDKETENDDTEDVDNDSNTKTLDSFNNA